jgi:pimeloyl-ACP methyl ester carboxylesterase
VITSSDLVARCQADAEFLLAARSWTGGFRLDIDGEVASARLDEGRPSEGTVVDGPGVITLAGSRALWDQVLSAVPPRFSNDIAFAEAVGLHRRGDDLTYWQYYPALARAIEVLRPEPAARAPQPAAAATDVAGPRFDSPIGRYVHLDLDGHDHRVYFEEAGQGIPLLLQHTAGSNGVQWRHLFEDARITDHFRLIAYDLPFHGKSVPPTTRAWWAEEYRLTRDFALSVPLTLAAALGLHRPVFMGCSVGGLLALDLARYHPDAFRAVIALEPALKIGGSLDRLGGFWHPQVSNEYKARLMNGLMSPTSPEALRRETVYAYSAGWPPAFLGDLYYYIVDHDLTAEAGAIDTSRVGVHLLTGEYDASATIEHGRAAHEAIAGSTFRVMDGVGHFPMSENPESFLGYLLPVLDAIRTGAP